MSELTEYTPEEMQEASATILRYAAEETDPESKAELLEAASNPVKLGFYLMGLARMVTILSVESAEAALQGHIPFLPSDIPNTYPDDDTLTKLSTYFEDPEAPGVEAGDLVRAIAVNMGEQAFHPLSLIAYSEEGARLDALSEARAAVDPEWAAASRHPQADQAD